VAQQRLHTIENGKAELVASEQVFAKWQWCICIVRRDIGKRDGHERTSQK
jgi:hypothetical protein